MFYLTTHLIHFIYGYMVLDYPRQDSTYHSSCYTSREALSIYSDSLWKEMFNLTQHFYIYMAFLWNAISFSSKEGYI